MKSSVVPGDMIGILGFDETTANYARNIPLSPPGTELFDEVEKLLTVDHSDPSLFQNRIDHFFVPMPFENTSFPEAFTQANRTFINAGLGSGVQNMVVMFSDGFTNCAKGGCENTLARHEASHAKTLEVLLTKANSKNEQTLKENLISVSFVLFGEKTGGPHTLVRTSLVDGSRCMDEAEAREYDKTKTETLPTWARYVPSTQANYLNGVRGISPFYNVNKAWEYTKHTGGLWLPLRPPCEMKSCGKSTVQECLDDLCAATSSSTSVVLPNTEWTDSEGRLTCDPLGRSRVEQIEDMMKSLLEQHPYVLVEELKWMSSCGSATVVELLAADGDGFSLVHLYRYSFGCLRQSPTSYGTRCQ